MRLEPFTICRWSGQVHRRSWTALDSHDLATDQMGLPPAGPQAQGWTGKCQSVHCQCLAGVGIHPLAIGQDRSKPATRRVADGERMNP